MDEKRKSQRFNIRLELKISSLFRQDNVLVEHIDEPITVIDMSKGGIGFQTQSILPIGYYFNACIQLNPDNDSKLYCVVKIIRCTDQNKRMNRYSLIPILIIW